jgi:hypothetical protein
VALGEVAQGDRIPLSHSGSNPRRWVEASRVGGASEVRGCSTICRGAEILFVGVGAGEVEVELVGEGFGQEGAAAEKGFQCKQLIFDQPADGFDVALASRRSRSRLASSLTRFSLTPFDPLRGRCRRFYEIKKMS